jgi:5-carboxymethyl-2-hydroxymuconate isomerase
MAHVTVEWSENLADDVDVPALLRLIATEMRKHSGGVFPAGGIRVRGIRSTDYVIADGESDRDAFIDMRVLMATGRPSEFRQRFFDQLFARVRDHLGDLFERRPLALSLYVTEADGWKHNSVHDRLAAKSA